MAGKTGSYLISWSQTCVEGLRSPPVAALETGASWSWSGEPVELEAFDAGLDAQGPDAFRRCAAHAVRRLLGCSLPPVRPVNGSEFGEVAMSRDFAVSCGRMHYKVTLVDVPEAARPLLLFAGQMPPAGRPLRIVQGLFPEPRAVTPVPEAGGVICFTSGTRLRTPAGPIPVEELGEGDLIDTRDGGPQEILWIGHRRLSGAQMHAMPELRPIRIRGGALGSGLPDRDLVVSPRHRILYRGRAAEAVGRGARHRRTRTRRA